MATGLLGIADMKQFAIPVGWDAGELAKFQFAGTGTTYDQVITDIVTALSIVNSGLLNDPLYGAMLSVTTEMTVEYRDGTANGMNERTEYGEPDARRGTTIGHMLPLKSFDRKLGWTYDFLRKARPIQLEADIADAAQDIADNWQRRALIRFFSNVENQLGTSGYDVPLIVGGGNVPYTPPSYDGKSFASTHTHFDRQTDDAAGRLAALKAGAAHLREHGIMPPYTAIVPMADQTIYTGLTEFIKPQRGIQYVRTDGSNGTTAVMPIDDRYFGAVDADGNMIFLTASTRVPTDYLGMWKPYGANDQRNPLRVRYSPDLGVGAILLRGEGFRKFPLENAIILQEFGVGIGDRLNGYACLFAAAGGYVVPTIS